MRGNAIYAARRHSTHSGRSQAESAVGGSGRIVAMLLRIIYYTEVFICCVGIYMLPIKKGGLMSGGLMSGGLMSGGLMSGGLKSYDRFGRAVFNRII